MPVLKYLAGTNAISDVMRPETPVEKWFADHKNEIGISTLTLAEMRRGIELKPEGKYRRALERLFSFILQDYAERIFFFDESAATEWGRMMAQHKAQPIPYDDSLIAAIARSCDMIVVTRNESTSPAARRSIRRARQRKARSDATDKITVDGRKTG